MGVKLLVERASWTLVDQGVVSFGNFLLNVLLARTLSEEDYGEFALFLGAIFILRAIDYSLISYPLSVRLCVASDEERAGLLGNTFLLTGGSESRPGHGHGAWNHAVGGRQYRVAGVSLLFVLAGAGDVAAMPARRFPLSCGGGRGRYRLCRTGPADCAAGLARWHHASGRALHDVGDLRVGALVHASKLRYARPDLAEARLLAREYFSVGKWSLVNYQLVLARVQLLPWMLAALTGTAATASLQAGLNIANMMNPIIFGIGNAVPQVAAHAHRTGGVIGASRAVYGYVLFGLSPILVISAAAVLMPELLLRTVYGPSSPYLAAAMGLQLLAVAGVLDYIAEMISKTLLGVQAGRLASAGQCRGRRRGGGAGLRAYRPARRVRCMPRALDRQSGARDRRRDRDRLADRRRKIARAGAVCGGRQRRLRSTRSSVRRGTMKHDCNECPTRKEQ